MTYIAKILKNVEKTFDHELKLIIFSKHTTKSKYFMTYIAKI